MVPCSCPCSCPCVVCTVHSIILKPIVSRSLSCPGPVQCVWAIKPRADVTWSPKRGYQWPHKKHWCPSHIFDKKRKKSLDVSGCVLVLTKISSGTSKKFESFSNFTTMNCCNYMLYQSEQSSVLFSEILRSMWLRSKCKQTWGLLPTGMLISRWYFTDKWKTPYSEIRNDKYINKEAFQ